MRHKDTDAKRAKSKKRKAAIELLGFDKMKLTRKPVPVTDIEYDPNTGYISYDPDPYTLVTLTKIKMAINHVVVDEVIETIKKTIKDQTTNLTDAEKDLVFDAIMDDVSNQQFMLEYDDEEEPQEDEN